MASVTVAALASFRYCFGSEMPASVIARVGPQLRSPSGGNLAALTKALASATVLIIGAMMPSAPKSSARLAAANAPSGMRTTGAEPAARIAAMRGGGRRGVPQAVLLIDGDGDETFARDRLGDDRRRQRAPAGVDGFAGGEAAGEGEAWEVGHQLNP